jgi:hypothetical protein
VMMLKVWYLSFLAERLPIHFRCNHFESYCGENAFELPCGALGQDVRSFLHVPCVSKPCTHCSHSVDSVRKVRKDPTWPVAVYFYSRWCYLWIGTKK